MIATAYRVERSQLLLAFGRKLRAEREHRNLSQEALAHIASLHRNEIGYLERGKQEPYVSTLLILAHTLGSRPAPCSTGFRCQESAGPGEADRRSYQP